MEKCGKPDKLEFLLVEVFTFANQQSSTNHIVYMINIMVLKIRHFLYKKIRDIFFSPCKIRSLGKLADNLFA